MAEVLLSRSHANTMTPMSATEPPRPDSAPGGVSVLGGALQQYAWGRVDALTMWAPQAPAGPHAELWFGAHPNGPSPVLSGDAPQADAAPVLVKLLAAASPLSIQVHPDAAGVEALSSSTQTAGLLADRGVKSEVLIALEDFDVLAGLRGNVDAAALLRAGLGEGHPACARLADGDRLAAVRAVLETPGRCDADAMLALLPSAERHVMDKVVAHYRDDVSLPVAFMLQPRTLRRHQAMFVPAGALHAYVDGFGVEVMTSSDNVLRLGLTPKQIAVDAALTITRAELEPVIVDDCNVETSVDGIPFSVQRLHRTQADISQPGSIALCVTGEVRVEHTDATLRPGHAAYLHSGSSTVDALGDCYIARPLVH